LPVRLRNQRDPGKILILTQQTWVALLDLAEEYGWNPYGVLPGGEWPPLDYDLGNYLPGVTAAFEDFGPEGGAVPAAILVILEDALNLADALEEAFRDYEPQHMPASFFLFSPDTESLQPSLGALTGTIDLAQRGAFWIETYPH
jgi:hypothetical protein